jgi:hypothetical protein
VAFFLTPGNIADISAAPDLLAIRSAAERLLAPSHGLQENHCRAMNKGYDANSLRNRRKAQGSGNRSGDTVHTIPQATDPI